MLFLRGLVGFALLFSHQSVLGEVEEIDSFERIDDVVKQADEPLLVWDLDETVLVPQQPFGGRRWYQLMTERFMEEYAVKPDQALRMSDALWTYLQQEASVQLTEPNLPYDLKALSSSAEGMMALTTRSPAHQAFTEKQLESLEIDFSFLVPQGLSDVRFREGDLFDEEILFENGVLYAANNSKGRVAKFFLERTGLAPKAIVFVNDELTYLKSIQEVFKHSEHQVLLFRYLGARDHMAKEASYIEQHFKRFEEIGSDFFEQIPLSHDCFSRLKSLGF